MADQVITLEESAAIHIGRVLRMKAGDSVILFNGEGGSWQCQLTESGKKSVQAKTFEFFPDNNESPLTIEIGQGLSRGERMDYAIQKATELGVTVITPLFTERCEVKLNEERIEKRMNHWQQVAISACEQCGRNKPPQINKPVQLKQWLDDRSTTLNLVLHHRTEQALSGFKKPDSVSLLIGPEGGLSADEIAMAEGNGCRPLALGPRVLRTETAPVAALALMQYLWGDLS